MEPTSYLIMAVALALGAFVKGATGMGLPLIALPVLTAAFGLQHAIGLMVIPLIVTNGWQVWRFRNARRSALLAFLPRFLLAGMLGIVLGSLLLVALPERLLVLGLGLLLLGYVALRLGRPHLLLSPQLALRLGPYAGGAGGVLQGATGLSAPVVVTFVHSMGLARDAHVFAVSAMFLAFSMIQLPSLLYFGVLQARWLYEGVVALVPILLVMPVGQALAGRLSRKVFDRMILTFLGLMGLKMTLGL